MNGAEREARRRILDAMANVLGVSRQRRWAWSPAWLRIWPFWESKRAFRYRAFALCTLTRSARAGTELGIRSAVAVAVGCHVSRVSVEAIGGPGDFVVWVRRWLPLSALERRLALEAIEYTRPVCTRCVEIRRV